MLPKEKKKKEEGNSDEGDSRGTLDIHLLDGI
jgi:hypothetical protein